MSNYTSPGPHPLDRDTFLSAVAMMDQYGEQATQYAARRAAGLEKQDDLQGSWYWDRVIVAILELERSWLRKEESFN